MKLKLLIVMALSVSVGYVAAPTMADWYPGDGHKMHFPQLPDPDGWDVEFNNFPNTAWQDAQMEADDWGCSQTGPVSDIHFWMSWWEDDIGTIGTVEVVIYDNDLSGTYSKPGQELWSRSFTSWTEVSPYGTGDQGFYIPLNNDYYPSNHLQYQQINLVDIQNPFIQQAGEIYWLGVYVTYPIWPQSPCGWKTSLDHYEDAAVYWDSVLGEWYVLHDPGGAPLSLSFVITPEPGTLALLALGGILVGRRRR
jgi:hypothetical protein